MGDILSYPTDTAVDADDYVLTEKVVGGRVFKTRVNPENLKVRATGSQTETTLAAMASLLSALAGAGSAGEAVILDESGNFVMPAGGQFEFSNATPAAAGAGANASDATVIAAQVNAVTGADDTKGVALPAAVDNHAILIINTVATAGLKVWPVASGNDAINGLSANAAFVIGPGRSAWFIATSATQWYADDTARLLATKTELDLIDGLTATSAALNAAVVGAAAGYKIARSASPVSLDGSNPTSVAHGLTTCVACFVQLVGSAAPGASTSVLTAVINGANLDVYAWKPNGAALTELVASTGTETFSWFAIGT